MATKSNLKVAIITDWLWKVRGAEKVLDSIVELFPNCEIYSLFGDIKELKTLKNVKNRKIHFSKLQKLPFVRKYYRYTYPIWPLVIESFDLSGFDLIISSSSSVAKGIIPPYGVPHISFIHTPMRYAWDMKDIYFKGSNFSLIKRLIIPFFLHLIRIWDSTRNNLIDYTMTNSNYVKRRIEKFYNLKVDRVIYPFFESEKISKKKKEDFYLYHGAFEPNKGVYECVQAALKYNFKLVLSGNGSMEKRIRRMIKGWTNIILKTKVDDKEKFVLMSQAKALLFPSFDDFGIVGLESLSAGTPVLALKESGISEVIKDGSNGVLIEKQSCEDIYKGIQRIENTKFNTENIKKSVSKFTRKRFQKEFMESIKVFLNE